MLVACTVLGNADDWVMGSETSVDRTLAVLAMVLMDGALESRAFGDVK